MAIGRSVNRRDCTAWSSPRGCGRRRGNVQWTRQLGDPRRGNYEDILALTEDEKVQLEQEEREKGEAKGEEVEGAGGEGPQQRRV